MKSYDPEVAPDPKRWLGFDEQKRMLLVERYHRGARIKLPSMTAHVAFHVIVENQLAEEMDSVVQAMIRLRRDGLSRHEAVHAVASVLAEHMHGLLNGEDGGADVASRYDEALAGLTAQRWFEG